MLCNDDNDVCVCVGVSVVGFGGIHVSFCGMVYVSIGVVGGVSDYVNFSVGVGVCVLVLVLMVMFVFLLV